MAENHLIICPGFHDPALTQSLLADLGSNPVFQNISIQVMGQVAGDDPSPWRVLSGYQVRQFIAATLGCPAHKQSQIPAAANLFFLAFSAGCVGAVGAARHWYALGGSVGALFAVDGWGVVLAEPFPVYRLSHDLFTHQTSRLLGGQPISFYADPPVPHLDIWRSPGQVPGWRVQMGEGNPAVPLKTPITAADFICAQLEQALETNPETLRPETLRARC